MKNIYESFNLLYANIYFILTTDETFYSSIRYHFDNIFIHQKNINRLYHENDDITYYKLIEIADKTYKDITDFYFNSNPASNTIVRMTKYKGACIFNKETDQIDLEKLLREDATSKAAKTYFEIRDHNMSLNTYLFYHKLPEDKKDFTDEQAVINDVIECLDMDLNFSLSMIYNNNLFKYLYYQDELSYFEIKNIIQEILIYKKQVDYIIKIWINKDSSLNNVIDIEKINDKEYNIMIEYCNDSDKIRSQRYKDIMISPDNYELEDLLEEDAYTDNAKRYFGLDIIEKEK